MKSMPMTTIRNTFVLGILVVGGLAIWGAWNLNSLVQTVDRLAQAATADELPTTDREQIQQALRAVRIQTRWTIAVLLGRVAIAVGLLLFATKLIHHEFVQRQITDRRLREREAHLQAILDSEPECINLIAEDGTLLEMNAAGLEMIEVGSASQVVGQRVDSLVVPEHRREFQSLRERVFRGESGTLEFQIIGLKGGHRWLDTHASPLRDERGRVIALLGVTRDITARKLAGEAMREANAQLSATLDAMPDLLFEVDVTGRIYDFRAPHPELLFLPPQQFLGKRMRDVLPADAAQIIDSAIQDANAKGLHRGSTYSLDLPQGRTWFELSIARKGPGLGTDSHFVLLAREITQRKQAEAALRNSEAMLELVLDSIPQGVFWKDRHSVYLGANHVARLAMGLTERHSVIGLTDFDVPHFRHEQAEFFVGKDREVMGSNQPQYAIIETMTQPDGSTIWLETNKIPMHDTTGNVSGILGTWENITASKQAKEELLASRERLAMLSRQLIAAQESERRQVARELHDEIGQVLTAVSLNLHHLKAVCGPEANSELDASLSLVDHAMTQVRDLSLNLRPPMLDLLGLDAAVRSCVEQHRKQTGCEVKLDLQLESRLSSELEITCYRVIQSALTNVARHAHASQVSVEIRENDSGVELTVCDNGIGFDINSVRQRSDQGESFGILAMQERVQLWGGTFHIDSAASGVGTSILAHFPLRTPPPSRGESS
ncbi:MAG: PAS domain-containing protein [Planctomycetaceae bacterium]|nr:PAS domain-containing protein [Planctomycetaceae bacterium]